MKYAIEAARNSPCEKSKRGVVIWKHDNYARGFNQLPGNMKCDGSDQCKAMCGKRCVHAETEAIMEMLRHHRYDDFKPYQHCAILHVKVGEDGELVPSKGPSCLECAKLIFAVGIGWVWLYEGTGNGHGQWKTYTAAQFYDLSCSAEFAPRR